MSGELNSAVLVTGQRFREVAWIAYLGAEWCEPLRLEKGIRDLRMHGRQQAQRFSMS